MEFTFERSWRRFFSSSTLAWSAIRANSDCVAGVVMSKKWWKRVAKSVGGSRSSFCHPFTIHFRLKEIRFYFLQLIERTLLFISFQLELNWSLNGRKIDSIGGKTLNQSFDQRSIVDRKDSDVIPRFVVVKSSAPLVADFDCHIHNCFSTFKWMKITIFFE